MPSDADEPAYIVKSSTIHNRGVFAARDLVKGERIIEYKGEKITKAESDRRGMAQIDASKHTGDGAVYLFILNKKHDIDGSMEWNLARLINHSCAPNCEAQIVRGKIWIIAKKKIKAGDELSFDYGFDLDCWQDHPCRCGKENCVGYIVGRQYWPKLRKLLAAKEAPAGKAAPPAKAPASRRGGKRAAKSGAQG